MTGDPVPRPAARAAPRHASPRAVNEKLLSKRHPSPLSRRRALVKTEATDARLQRGRLRVGLADLFQAHSRGGAGQRYSGDGI